MLDILLRPFLEFVPSFIRDDLDILNKLPTTIAQTCIFATFDVVGLYSNIDNNLGLKAIDYWLTTFNNILHSRFCKEFVLNILHFVLTNNIFLFNDKHFLQVSGVAMGTKMAPTYANLVMAYLEVQLYKNLENSESLQYANYVKENWKRYIDDGFIIWDNQIGNIETFHNYLNNLHHSITFTKVVSQKQIAFLDILIINNNNNVITDIFYKPTDTHSYLHFNSCHKKHIKLNIPYNLARRICTIVNNCELKEVRLKELECFLFNRNYPLNIIKQGIKKALNIPVQQLRNNSTSHNNKDNILTFVKTHNPNNPNITHHIYNNLPYLTQSNIMDKVLSNTKIITSNRQSKNIKHMLCTFKYKSKGNNQIFQVNKCAVTKCKVCPVIIEDQVYKFKNGQSFFIKDNMSCTSENLLYVLRCNNCKEEYIGQTSDTLRHRMTVHRQHITHQHYRVLYVSNHIASCGDNVSYSVFPFYKFRNNDNLYRNYMEKHFILKFKPLLNRAI